MAIENKDELINVLVSRVTENAPVKELIRVYCEALTSLVQEMDEGDLIQAILSAGYLDIMEAFNLTEESMSDSEAELQPVEA